MTDARRQERPIARRVIRVWFAADFAVALFPPLHWAASGTGTAGGVPLSLVYLFASAVFIAASVIAAYWLDPAAR